MTPAELDEYLAVLRTNGVMAGLLEIDGNKISVQFEPRLEPTKASAEPESGGWKHPTVAKPEAPNELDLPFSEQDLP